MKPSVILSTIVIAGAVCACGVESASTAATAAAVKQKELEAGRKTMSEAERKIGESMQQLREGVQKSGEAEK